MKKLLVALCFTCALALAVQAEEGKKKEHKKMTDEQKTVYNSMLEKYDTNKDKKLDKEDGCWEVKGTKDGKRVEAYFDPVTAEVVLTK